MAMKGKTAACSLILSVRGSWSVILIATVGVRIEHLSEQYTVCLRVNLPAAVA